MKIGKLETDRSVKLVATVPESVGADLDAYSECYMQTHGAEASQSRLVSEMLRRFMQDDTEFQRWLKTRKTKAATPVVSLVAPQADVKPAGENGEAVY